MRTRNGTWEKIQDVRQLAINAVVMHRPRRGAKQDCRAGSGWKCSVEDCGRRANRKPFCATHIDHMPYARSVMEEAERLGVRGAKVRD